MDSWPRRLDAFRRARSSAIESSSSTFWSRKPGLRWERCCFLEPWPFRGVGWWATEDDPPAWLGRRTDSKLAEALDWLGPGEWIGVDETERDLPGFEEVEVMVAARPMDGRKKKNVNAS